MRPLLLLLLASTPGFAQLFSFGVKGGVPLTDFVDTASNGSTGNFINFATHTDRYIVGPTVELRLPFGLGVELDALYRHVNYQETLGAVNFTTNTNTTGHDFEFPLLGKYRFLHTKLVKPYIDAGVAFDTIQGLSQTVTNAVAGSATPSQLLHSTTHGYVFGGGIDIKLLVIHIQPEIRYTRWGAEHFFDPSGLLHSNENQGEFLLGITF